MHHKQLLPAIILALPLTGNTNEATGGDVAEQPLMVVTASRFSESLDETLAAVSVIDSEAIQRSLAQDLHELLRLEAGVDIVRTGPAGAQTSLFMRGTNSNHTLVLIDGIRVASSNTGTAGWEHLPLSQIERIEIVRGSRAGVYGSDAMGGVIQIFTRNRAEHSLRLSAGSFGTREAAGNLGFHKGSAQFNLGIANRSSDGYSAQNSNGFSFHPDDDGYNNFNVLLNGGLSTARGNLQFSLLAVEAKPDFDQGVSKSNQNIASLVFAGSGDGPWQQQVQLGYASDELASDFGFFNTRFESRRFDFGWQHQYQLKANTRLLYGVDYREEEGENDNNYDRSRDNSGAYFAFRTELGSQDLEANLRYDHNSEFGSKSTGLLAWGFHWGKHWRLFASYGTAFRTPTLNEQFSPGFGGLFAGNPRLQPESSDTIEAGLRWQPDAQQSITLNVFQTDVDDLIAFTGVNFQAVNVNQASISGVELAWKWRNDNWRVKSAFTWQDTRDKTNNGSLLRRPDEKIAINVDRQLGPRAWAGAEFLYTGKRQDLGATLASYQLLNLRAALSIGANWQVQARLENLLDEAYQPAQGFNGMGQAAFISLNWQR